MTWRWLLAKICFHPCLCEEALFADEAVSAAVARDV
jgi:hypothetical protein